MEDSDMIIIAYLFLLQPSEYMVSKSESTPFRLKHTAFSCNCSIFVATAMEGDLQASNFIMLKLTDQKNGVRGGGGGGGG